MLLLFSLLFPQLFKEKKLTQNINKEESVVINKFYLGFYFTLPKVFKSTTPNIIRAKPTIPKKFGV